MAAEQPDTWGLAELEFATELIVSELVTNAIQYGYGPIQLRLIRNNMGCIRGYRGGSCPCLRNVGVSGMPAVLAGGVYRLVCVRSGKALDDNGNTSDGAAMVQRTDNGSPQQQWAITALGGGAYRLTNRHSGKVLDNANTDTEGSTVIQWSANGGSPQQWNMTKIG